MPSLWTERLIRLARRLQQRVRRPIAVAICHCHYEDLMPDLIGALEHLPAGAHLHVSSSDVSILRQWHASWRRAGIPLRTHHVENRGRDVRPFFEVMRKLSVRPDTPVLKIHGKRSHYTSRGAEWRRDLLAGLLPGQAGVAEIVGAFRTDPRLGMVGAPRSFISSADYWGANRAHVGRLMRAILGRDLQDDDLGFYAGTMFWVRAAVIQRMLPCVDPEAFEPEAGQIDGTYAHALERAIPMVAEGLGYRLRENGGDGDLARDEHRDRRVIYI